MKHHATFTKAVFLVTLLLASHAWAADCQSMRNTPTNETYKLSTQDIVDCVQRGWDPPRNWAPSPTRGSVGTAASGSGGFANRTIEAPETPPRVAGGAPTVSSAVMSFINKLKSIFKSNSGTPGSTDPQGGIGSHLCTHAPNPAPSMRASWNCPVRDSVQNYYPACPDFGPVTSFSSAQTVSLGCGGAIPLTNYRITLVNNPNGFIRTDYKQYYIWIYSAGSASYQLTRGGAVALPKFLCEWYKDKKGTRRKRPSSNPPYSLAPTGQMVTFNDSTQAIALRVVPRSPTDFSNPFSPASQTEKFLVLPVSGGSVYVPRDDTPNNDYRNCDIQDDYFKPYTELKGSSLSGDIVMEASQVPGCEADQSVCDALGQSIYPSASEGCETSTLYPSGGDGSCKGKIQYILLDRPNLYFPPGSAASVLPIDGVTSYMVSTQSNGQFPARIVGNSDTVVHLNRSPSTFTFTSGGRLGLANDQRLVMYGPATLDMSNLQITLTGGAEIDDNGGTPLGSYPANSTFPISEDALPLNLVISSDIIMPPTYVIPSQPAVSFVDNPESKTMPFVREPLTPPQ